MTQRSPSPVFWARWWTFSQILASLVKPRTRPILLLALPRSGSSWIGSTLGRASNALYLREPVTQSEKSICHGQHPNVFNPDDSPIEAAYRHLANKAFSGNPDFDTSIVRFSAQWRLTLRRFRKVVIKEVNPLACQWYVRLYKPYIILLVRHPAPTALSYSKMGWLKNHPDAWSKSGIWQAKALSSALKALTGYDYYRIVFYEDFCVEPLFHFKELFQATNLIWDKQIQEFIRHSTSGGDENLLYGTSRNSREMKDKWRGHIPQTCLDAIKKQYMKFNLPWYTDERVW